MRERISAAALLVNVTAISPCGETPHSMISHAARWVSTRVLPLPAPASTSIGPTGAETAARWASFRVASRLSIVERGFYRLAKEEKKGDASLFFWAVRPPGRLARSKEPEN